MVVLGGSVRRQMSGDRYPDIGRAPIQSCSESCRWIVPALWRSRWAGCTGPAPGGHLQQRKRSRPWTSQSRPARPPSGIKWTVGVPYSDGTRPKRFIKDYRIICPIARQNYIGLRSHQKVQGPDTLSHVWDFLISQESSEVRYRQHIHPIAVFRASIVKNVTRSQKILASPESYIYVQCFTDEEHSSYMCGARNSYV